MLLRVSMRIVREQDRTDTMVWVSKLGSLEKRLKTGTIQDRFRSIFGHTQWISNPPFRISGF